MKSRVSLRNDTHPQNLPLSLIFQPSNKCMYLLIYTHLIINMLSTIISYSGPVQTELLPVSSGSKSSSIKGGDSSCSWVFICARGLVGEGGVTGCNAGWGLVMCGELTSSSNFTSLHISVFAKTLTLGRIQTLSFSTVFIDYS